MGEVKRVARDSVFQGDRVREVVRRLVEQTKQLYLSDSVPWVVGYSGGKDSTAALQVVWMAVSEIEKNRRTKQIHVISTDTLVENPIVSAWVSRSLEVMNAAAQRKELPIQASQLTPDVDDSFWVNLIGRGYPAPRHKFRWCTERLKIKPSNRFILDVVREDGEAILVLGTRKAESSQRASRMDELEEARPRDLLSPNAGLPNSLVYTPIEDWSNDDVWLFLLQYANPWGYENKQLLTMYQGASEGGECPLVVDTSTPSCGDSRFGCWVCTLVEKDKSMDAMIRNDQEKEWMLPLMKLRDELDIHDDRHLRDFRRMAGHVQLYNDRLIPGPYTQQARETWLRKLLEAERWIQKHGPRGMPNLELIKLDELEAIRRIWVYDKHEREDNLPRIYGESRGESYPGGQLEDSHVIGHDDMALLREVCDGDELHFQLIRELLDVEGRYRTFARRSGLFGALDAAFSRGAYEGIEEATATARWERDTLAAARAGNVDVVERMINSQDRGGVSSRTDEPE